MSEPLANYVKPRANAKIKLAISPFFPETQTFNHAFKKRPTVCGIITVRLCGIITVPILV